MGWFTIRIKVLKRNSTEFMLRGDEILKEDIKYVLSNRGNIVEENEGGVCYLAYPSKKIPRFLIPKKDKEAQKFILRMMSVDKGVRGYLVRVLVNIPGGLSLVRSVVFKDHLFVKND